MNDDLLSLFAYNRWADDRVVAAARTLTPEQYTREPAPGWASIRATLVHVADATWIWARRLRGEAVSARATEVEVPTLEDAVRLLARGQESFDRLVSELTPERLASAWVYRDLKGKENRAPL